ncbi:MAG: thiamine phosphate synthase [Candidatus Omnitrophica bacterium]|nr:thiamine phosphate synthase [Candidatus Omnitrophota bacterium]
MKSKKRLLRGSRLYVIIDKKACTARSPAVTVKEAADSGADLVQLRDKESARGSVLRAAYAIRKELSGKKTIFIVNDYLDIAKISDADGVHLGQDDHSVGIARRILGKDKIIGISCRSVAQAKSAQKQGADYIGVGPIFRSITKPALHPKGLGLIRRIRKSVEIPFFVLGGLNEDNLACVRAYGADRIAVCSAVCGGKDVSLSTKELSNLLH